MKTPGRVVSLLIKGIGICAGIGLLVFAIQFLRVDHSAQPIIESGGNPGAAVDGYPSPPQPSSQPTPLSLENLPYPAPNITPTHIDQLQALLKTLPKITPTIPLIADDGWYIFEDKEVGYSFHYPPNSHLSCGIAINEKYLGVTLEYRVPNEVSYHGLAILVEPNTKNQTPMEFAEQIAQSYGPTANLSEEAISKSSTYSIAQLSAVKISIPQTMTDYTLFLPYKDKMLIIKPTGNPMVMDDPVKVDALKIFDQILATFKFEP
jgi:hypothetical protein